jgi:CheY-like chemotaxis protein
MKKKVLIVDDNVDLNKILQLSLKNSYETISARNGEEAVELALMEVPDLIIMDLMMGGTNGFEAIRLIRKVPKTRSIPIIAITAGLSNTIKDECSRIGCNDFIGKPFTYQQLVSRMEKLLQETTKKAESSPP